MLFGIYLCLLGVAIGVSLIHTAAIHEVAGISSRSSSATFLFKDEPVAATITIAVNLLCSLAMAAFGGNIFLGARNRKVGP